MCGNSLVPDWVSAGLGEFAPRPPGNGHRLVGHYAVERCSGDAEHFGDRRNGLSVLAHATSHPHLFARERLRSAGLLTTRRPNEHPPETLNTCFDLVTPEKSGRRNTGEINCGEGDPSVPDIDPVGYVKLFYGDLVRKHLDHG